MSSEYSLKTDQYESYPPLRRRADEFVARSPLIRACGNGERSDVDCLAAVRSLINDSDVCARINDVDERSGLSALHVACLYDRASVVNELVARGADTDVCSSVSSFVTPLMLASSADVTRALIAAGASIGAVDDYEWTALMYAARRGNGARVIPELLAAGASLAVNTLNNSGGTLSALMIAACTNQLANVRLLLEHGASLRDALADSFTPLDHAARIGHNAVVREMPRFHPNEVRGASKTVAIACENLHVGVVATLISAGAIVTGRVGRRTLIEHALVNGICTLPERDWAERAEPMVDLLLSHGAFADERLDVPFCNAGDSARVVRRIVLKMRKTSQRRSWRRLVLRTYTNALVMRREPDNTFGTLDVHGTWTGVVKRTF